MAPDNILQIFNGTQIVNLEDLKYYPFENNTSVPKCILVNSSLGDYERMIETFDCLNKYFSIDQIEEIFKESFNVLPVYFFTDDDEPELAGLKLHSPRPHALSFVHIYYELYDYAEFVHDINNAKSIQKKLFEDYKLNSLVWLSRYKLDKNLTSSLTPQPINKI